MATRKKEVDNEKHVTMLSGPMAKEFLREYEHHSGFSVVDKSTDGKAVAEIRWID